MVSGSDEIFVNIYFFHFFYWFVWLFAVTFDIPSIHSTHMHVWKILDFKLNSCFVFIYFLLDSVRWTYGLYRKCVCVWVWMRILVFETIFSFKLHSIFSICAVQRWRIRGDSSWFPFLVKKTFQIMKVISLCGNWMQLYFKTAHAIKKKFRWSFFFSVFLSFFSFSCPKPHKVIFQFTVPRTISSEIKTRKLSFHLFTFLLGLQFLLIHLWNVLKKTWRRIFHTGIQIKNHGIYTLLSETKQQIF